MELSDYVDMHAIIEEAIEYKAFRGVCISKASLRNGIGYQNEVTIITNQGAKPAIESSILCEEYALYHATKRALENLFGKTLLQLMPNRRIFDSRKLCRNIVLACPHVHWQDGQDFLPKKKRVLNPNGIASRFLMRIPSLVPQVVEAQRIPSLDPCWVRLPPGTVLWDVPDVPFERPRRDP